MDGHNDVRTEILPLLLDLEAGGARPLVDVITSIITHSYFTSPRNAITRMKSSSRVSNIAGGAAASAPFL